MRTGRNRRPEGCPMELQRLYLAPCGDHTIAELDAPPEALP